MDKDRFDVNSKAFVISMVCLLLCLTLLAFSLYLLPYLIWNWNYDIPESIFIWHQWLKDQYNFSDSAVHFIIFLSFFIPAVITGYIAYRLSNEIDKEVLGLTTPETKIKTEVAREQLNASMTLGFRLLIIILLIIAAVFLFEWLITRTTVRAPGVI